jgi:hypothetical protein
VLEGFLIPTQWFWEFSQYSVEKALLGKDKLGLVFDLDNTLIQELGDIKKRRGASPGPLRLLESLTPQRFRCRGRRSRTA